MRMCPMVVSIVQTAITAAPEQHADHLPVRDRLDAGIDHQVQACSPKSIPTAAMPRFTARRAPRVRKAPKPATIVAATANPLDRLYMPVMTPIITSRPVTEVNPSTGYRY